MATLENTVLGTITERKKDTVAKLVNEFSNSSAVILTEYRGLTVSAIKDLRVKLAANANYVVAKNTLFKIAANEAKVEVDETQLKGPSALAYVVGDVVATAKTLRDFAKTNEALVIKGAVMDGQILDAEGVDKLASLESREVLLAKAAGMVKSSIAKAAFVAKAPLSKGVRTFEALKAKKEA